MKKFFFFVRWIFISVPVYLNDFKKLISKFTLKVKLYMSSYGIMNNIVHLQYSNEPEILTEFFAISVGILISYSAK